MANLIITVIAIALVAVASLMGAYYGGSAFLNNQSAAGASTVLNEGQQIAGAWSAFLSDNYDNPPDQVTCLTGGACAANQEPGGGGPVYLVNLPNYPAAAGGVTAATFYIGTVNSHYYAWADVGHPTTTTWADPAATACLKIIKAATGTLATFGNSTTAPQNAGAISTNTTYLGNNTFGCSPIVASSLPTALNGSGAAPANGDFVLEYRLN